MTFLNPLFLWFLPLTAIPVIIHLLAKRKSKLIDFPSLRFLKLLEQDALKKFNVKQLILLIIRTLMILFLILAFARPGLDRMGGFNLKTGNVELLVIAIDNTASNRSNFVNLNTDWVEKISDGLLEKGFKVVYCGLTDLQFYESFLEINAEYADAYSGDYLEAFSEQVDLSQYERKTLLWIGDGQDVRIALESLEGWHKYLLLTPVINDAGVSDVRLPNQGVRLGDTYEISVELQRSSGFMEALGLELQINEKRQNQLVAESDQQFVRLSARVDEGGYQSGKLILGSDEAIYNNQRHFILPAEGSIPIQILRANQNPDFWGLIKSSVEEQQLNLDVRVLAYSEIDNLDLSRGGTVIVDDASQLVPYNWARLENFVRGGGQVILFGEGGASMEALMGFKAPLVEESNALPLGLYVTGTAIKAFNTEPLAAIIGQNRLKVYKRYQTQGIELQETWVRFLDDEPFLGANKIDKGRIIWFNTDFNIGSNNLPLLGMFPTVITQLAQSQSLQSLTEIYNAEMGDTLHFYPLIQSNDNSPFSVQRPDGTMDYISPDENYVLHYPDANLPGIYKLTRGRQVLQQMALNISSHEAMAHSIAYSFDESDIFVANNVSDIETRMIEQGANLALWPFLFLLILVLWTLETYLSRIKKSWREND